jgi:hypothetical protein
VADTCPAASRPEEPLSDTLRETYAQRSGHKYDRLHLPVEHYTGHCLPHVHDNTTILAATMHCRPSQTLPLFLLLRLAAALCRPHGTVLSDLHITRLMASCGPR